MAEQKKPQQETNYIGQLEKLHDVNAEASVLSVLMNDSSGIKVPKVREEYFYREPHKIIYRYLNKMYDNGETIEPIGLLTHIRQHNDEKKCGGVDHINALMDFVFGDELFDNHLKILVDMYNARRMALLFINSITELTGGKLYTDIASEVMSQVMDIYNANGGGNIEGMDVAIMRVVKEMDNRVRSDFFQCTTGFGDLDSILGPLNQGHLIVLAGRPGMGKSVTALCIILNNILMKVPCGLINYEMTTEETMIRMLSNVARQSFVDLVNRKVNVEHPEEAEQIMRAISTTSDKLYELPLYQRDDVNGMFGECKATITNMVKMHGVRLVVIDYLQLMTLDRSSDNANMDIGKMMRGLKILAKQLRIVIIILSQLNRNLENRKDKRPMLADLRESGSIEQDADRVIFCYRDDYYNELSPKINIMEAIVAKNRHGRTGTAELYYAKEYSSLAGLHHE